MHARLSTFSRLGQGLWYGGFSRRALASGELRLLVASGVTGIAIRPSAQERAIAAGHYDAQVTGLLRQGLYPEAVLRELTVADARAAADLLAPVYSRTRGTDGYVSVELAFPEAPAAAEIEGEALALWDRVGRRNAMIGIPATPPGIAAGEELVARGINVDATRIFSRQAHERVLEAYQAGLERRAAAGLPLREVAGVASFFLSGLDSAVDALLEERAGRAPDAEARGHVERLRGRAAVAVARLAHRRQQELLSSERWDRLESRGARRQRLLWAGTGSGVPPPGFRYLEELAGPGTVAAVPRATMQAFRKHGRLRSSVAEALAEAAAAVEELRGLGIDLEAVGDRLLADDLRQVEGSYRRLIASIDGRRREGLAAGAGG